MIELIGDRIVDPLSDPELRQKWETYIELCNTPFTPLDKVSSAFSSYYIAWKEKRDRAMARGI